MTINPENPVEEAVPAIEIHDHVRRLAIADDGNYDFWSSSSTKYKQANIVTWMKGIL